MTVRTTFRQAFKFGLSGILGAGISAFLYYGYRDNLPRIFVTLWSFRANLVDVCYYMMASIVGGSIHFTLSKLWVFMDERVRITARRLGIVST